MLFDLLLYTAKNRVVPPGVCVININTQCVHNHPSGVKQITGPLVNSNAGFNNAFSCQNVQEVFM